MAGRIPSAFIDELLQRIDIVEIIDKHVPLKKAGREYTACCPFHHEKTPSFTVSPDKQFYHCFGCGVHGSAIGFLMQYEHLDFVEAVEELARIAGVEIPYEQRQTPTERQQHKDNFQQLYDCLAQCDRFFRQQLRQHPQAPAAVAYLKSRGLSGEIAARFNIGYAPAGWSNLSQAFPSQQDVLLATGMLIRKEDGGVYDRFRHRIMFPIRDNRGRVIAFGGRILPEQDTGASRGDGKTSGMNSPKYLNSPETPLFHKGRELYGLYEARQALRQIPRLLVVEGYMDVVALAQHEIAYAVATLGTATTAEHLQRLFRVTEEVVFCFDGDRAGREAAWRALEQALSAVQEGRSIRFLFLPEGEDPDTLVRQIGKAGFEALIDKALMLSEYFFSSLQAQVDLTRFEGRARLVELAKPLLLRLPTGIYRQMMLEQLAQLARMDITQIHAIFKTSPTQTAARPNQANKPFPPRSAPSLVRRSLELLLHAPDLAHLVTNRQSLDVLQAPGANLLRDLLETLQKNPNLNTAAILERWRDTTEGKHLAILASWHPPFSDPDSLKNEFLGALNRLVEQHREARTEFLLAKANMGALSPDEKTELRALLNEPVTSPF